MFLIKELYLPIVIIGLSFVLRANFEPELSVSVLKSKSGGVNDSGILESADIPKRKCNIKNRKISKSTIIHQKKIHLQLIVENINKNPFFKQIN